MFGRFTQRGYLNARNDIRIGSREWNKYKSYVKIMIIILS